MRRFNGSQFIWFIILCCFSTYLFYILKSGKIYTYIHPRMIKYTILSLVGFMILGIYQVGKIFTISRKSNFKFGYVLFLIPFILAFKANGFDTSIVGKKGVNISDSLSNTTVTSSNIQNVKINYIENGVVNFTDINFYKILSDMSANITEYEGKKVEITGFIYKDNSLKKNEFIISRMMMYCCAADAQVVGLLCTWDNSTALTNGQWIKLEGNITSTQYSDPSTGKEEEMPAIIVQKFDNVSSGSQYIFP